MRTIFQFASVAAIAAMLSAPVAAQKSTGPRERYEMDAATMSGFAAMAGGPNGRGGGMGGAMSMMFGGGPDNALARQLVLRLGSNEAPTAPPPKADHFFLPQAKLGKSVQLLGRERPDGDYPAQFERPRGRLLLYWGCGATAGPGQPVVIDFAKVAAGQMPPNLFSTAVPLVREVTPENSKSYVEWPNTKSNKMPSRDSSLLGAHRVASSIGPDINFTLAQDYMPALQASTAANADGSVTIRWNPVTNATGYAAWTIGGMGNGGGKNDVGDIVWWTSSATKEFGGGLWDWLPPSVVANLITRKIAMPPSQTTCQIPAEVKKASGAFMMGNLNAFGPEANFSYPPKPATGVWTLDWTAKVRFRSYTMLMVGADFGGMSGGGAAGGSGDTAPPKKKKCKGPLGIPLPDGAC